jgi:erythromycin esterase-like protein
MLRQAFAMSQRDRRNKAKDRSEAFLAWAKRSALPLPVSHDEPLGNEVQAVLDRMLEGKRFVFLGEPDHFIIEKYPFRLVLTKYLFQRGWRHAAMETGRSIGSVPRQHSVSGGASMPRRI